MCLFYRWRFLWVLWKCFYNNDIFFRVRVLLNLRPRVWISINHLLLNYLSRTKCKTHFMTFNSFWNLLIFIFVKLCRHLHNSWVFHLNSFLLRISISLFFVYYMNLLIYNWSPLLVYNVILNISLCFRNPFIQMERLSIAWLIGIWSMGLRNLLLLFVFFIILTICIIVRRAFLNLLLI